jgi:plasmid stabilization system protein ParE
MSGRPRPEFGEKLRSFVVDRYVIFYELEQTVLRIARDISSGNFGSD